MVLQPQGDHGLNAPLIDAHHPLRGLGVGVGNFFPGVVIVGNGHRVVPVPLDGALRRSRGALGGGRCLGGTACQQGEGQGGAQDPFACVFHRFLLHCGARKNAPESWDSEAVLQRKQALAVSRQCKFLYLLSPKSFPGKTRFVHNFRRYILTRPSTPVPRLPRPSVQWLENLSVFPGNGSVHTAAFLCGILTRLPARRARKISRNPFSCPFQNNPFPGKSQRKPVFRTREIPS